jgi:Tfp pilus assembly protein PilP
MGKGIAISMMLALVTLAGAAQERATVRSEEAVTARAIDAEQAPGRATGRRDPFAPLVARTGTGARLPDRLPPGKAGLIIGTLRIDGIVRSPNGMIAVVQNQQQRVYFLREGDQLYDGAVERILMDSVVFRESSRDPFGRPVERVVTKRLYPSAGEQQ